MRQTVMMVHDVRVRWWARAPRGAWHLLAANDSAECGVRFKQAVCAEFGDVPDGRCRHCAARYRHQISHPPLKPVAYDDLDLTQAADQERYRERVAKTFELTQINTVFHYVLDAGGPRVPARRDAVVAALADVWISQALD